MMKLKDGGDNGSQEEDYARCDVMGEFLRAVDEGVKKSLESEKDMEVSFVFCDCH